MVNYAYRSLFRQTQVEKDILIVDSLATVTSVSNQAPTVTGATIEIHTEDVLINTFALDEFLNSEDNLVFGSLESASVSFDIRNSSSIPNLKDEKLKVFLYFGGDSDTLFQVGEYTCSIDKYSADRQTRNVELFDAIYFIRDLDITAWYNGVYQNTDVRSISYLRNSLFTWIADNSEVVVSQETTSLVNDSFLVEKGIESDLITFEFFMKRIMEVNGVFGHIGRTGLFEYKSMEWYDTQSVETVSDDFREAPTQYEDHTVWGIGYVKVYDENNIFLKEAGSTNRRFPSNYYIFDSFVFSNNLRRANFDSDFTTALTNMREKVTHLRYKPCEVRCVGDLSLEVGDKIDVQYATDENDQPVTFYTYILERHFTGLGTMRDVYSARGDKKQPKPQLSNSNWHIGDSQNVGTSGEGTGGVSTLSDTNMDKFVEIIRNIGFRLLDEPTNVNVVYNAPTTIPAQTYTYTNLLGDDREYMGNLNLADGSATNPVTVDGVDYTAVAYDYVKYWYDNGDSDGYVGCFCIFGTDGKWHTFSSHAADENVIADISDGDTVVEASSIVEGATIKNLTINGNPVTAQYGDGVIKSDDSFFTYLYPGVWIAFDVVYTSGFYDITVQGDPIRTSPNVGITWDDPEDIATSEPISATWDGTVVIRNASRPPLHKWDGDLIIDSKVRDAYSVNALTDESISLNQKYYYGIFPYDTNGNYRFTKVVTVDTGASVEAPTITNLSVNELNITVTFTIPEGDYTGLYITAKKNGIPTTKDDGTKLTIASQSTTTTTFENLDSNSLYYFVIFTESDAGNASSDPESATTDKVWMGEEVDFLYSGDTNKMTAQISDNHILFKMYLNNTVIYQFNAYSGTTTTDATNIYVGFVYDTEKEVAKPSLVYQGGTNYTYNAENPTYAEMQDIYTWLEDYIT